MSAVLSVDTQIHEAERAVFRKDVLVGLALPQKAIPAKYFYDAEGARLFDRICELPEYYPTRTEISILRTYAADIARLLPEHAVLVEFGSGASSKVRILLDALARPSCYVAIDISRDYLVGALRGLARDYPRLRVLPVAADFTGDFHMPVAVPVDRRVGFFPGSTIGNFDPPQAQRLLARMAQQLGPSGELLIGVDLQKDQVILEDAYNDADGITAAFNLNLLARINRELVGTFDLQRFAHRAFYDTARGRIEMHLECCGAQTVRIGDVVISFRDGETIHTENSYKYTPDGFRALAEAAGYTPVTCWTDPAQWFSVHLLRVEAGSAPAHAPR